MVDFFPNTGSTLYTNRTGIALSTNIIILAGKNKVGAIQNISINEQRSIRMIDEVGSDGHLDSAPERSANVSGTCERIRFDRMRILESFGRDFIHIKSQRIPFNIEIHDRWQGDASKMIITIIENVWFESMSYRYDATNWIVSESANWQAETIYSYFPNGQSVATGGGGGDRQIQLQVNSIEQEADKGKLRGAIDSPGLIDAAFTV